MLKAFSVLVLGVGLLAPVAPTMFAFAAPGTPAFADDHRHEWNDHESEAWHRYLKAKHIRDHEWDHATKREQANYWKWRDSHPDAH